MSSHCNARYQRPDEDATFSSQISGGVPPYKYEWIINTVDILSNSQNFDINFYEYYGDDIKEFQPSGLLFIDLIVIDANGVWGSDGTYVSVVPPEPEVVVAIYQEGKHVNTPIMNKPYELRINIKNNDDNSHYYSLKLKTPPEDNAPEDYIWNINPTTTEINNDLQTQLIQPGDSNTFIYEFKNNWFWIPPEDGIPRELMNDIAELLIPTLAKIWTVEDIFEILTGNMIAQPNINFIYKSDELLSSPTIICDTCSANAYVGDDKMWAYYFYLADKTIMVIGPIAAAKTANIYVFLSAPAAWLQSKYYYKKAIDPDPDYEIVINPEPYNVPEINYLPDGLYKELAQISFEMLSYNRAEVESYVRYVAADEDNAYEYELLQLEAVKKYNDMYLEKIGTVNNIYRLIIQDQNSLTDEEITDIKNDVSTNGLPTEWVSILTREGLENEIPDVIQTILDTDDTFYKNPSLVIDGNIREAGIRATLSDKYVKDIIEIKVNKLGQIPNEATQAEIEELESLKIDIQSGLDKGYATQELKDNIQSMLDLANALIFQTNNNEYLHYYSFARDAQVNFLTLQMPIDVYFLPPITTMEMFSLTDGSTLPIKFTAMDNYTGEFIYDDTVNVTITNSTGHLITYFTNGTGTDSVRIDPIEEQYIVNFDTRNYVMNVGETYAITATFGESNSLRGYAIVHFTLIDGTPPSPITKLQSTPGTTWINWTWTNPPDPDFNHTEIYLNGVFRTITSAEHFNATDLTPETSYTIGTRTVDTAGNINQTWANDTATTLSAGDTIPPTIISVSLDAYTTIPDATTHVTVNAADNAGVTSVTADGASLAETGSIWEGDITVPSTTGDYTLTIRAEDAADNAAETAVDYSVVNPSGSIGIGVDPRLTTVSAGDTALINIKLVSTENFDDIAHIYLTTEGTYPGYQADLTWFNWTSIEVEVPAGSEVNVPLEVSIPSGESGYKMFYAKLESTKWTPTAMDTGILYII